MRFFFREYRRFFVAACMHDFDTNFLPSMQDEHGAADPLAGWTLHDSRGTTARS
jgi:hypothetical protein